MKYQKAIEAQNKFIKKLVSKCTHALTLQTNLSTYNISNKKLEQKISLATGSISTLKPKLNRLLTGNGYVRNPLHIPILVIAQEGTLNTYDRYRTLHYHIALGNFDINRLDINFLEKLIQYWTETGIGTNDIKLRPLVSGREYGWGSYINKEAYRGNEQCIDYLNSQVPKHLLVD